MAPLVEREDARDRQFASRNTKTAWLFRRPRLNGLFAGNQRMSTLGIVVALLRGAHMAALVSLFGTLVFLTLVAPAAMAEAAKDAPRLRRRLLRVARISAATALIVGIAWIAVESAVIAGAGSVAMTFHALPVVALRTQFGQWLLVRAVLLLAVLPLLRPWRAGMRSPRSWPRWLSHSSRCLAMPARSAAASAPL